MSDDKKEDARPKVKVEYIGLSPESALRRKLGELQGISTPSSVTKAAQAFAAAQRVAGTSKASEIVASLQKSAAHLDGVIGAHDHMHDLLQDREFDWANMPEARRTRAAEETAEALRILVDEAIDAKNRAAATERRETVMLRWTVAGVLLAAIAAVASIVTVVLG